jgi:copper transporter 1
MEHGGHGHLPNDTNTEPSCQEHDEIKGMGSMNHMMKMYFHVGFDINILIYGWDATTNGRLLGTIAAVFLLGIVYEWIKFMRILLAQDVRDNCSSVDLPSVGKEPSSSLDTPSWFKKNNRHIMQSILYFFQASISFILMLLVMTFNIWIFLAVVFGMGFGYFLFAPVTRGFKVEDCCN